MSDLPKNWEYGKLSQAAHVVRGITFPAGEKRNDLAQGYVCCLRTTNVQRTLEWVDVYYVPTSYVKRDEQLVREGDVLMSMANSYELVGKVARAVDVPQPAAFGAFLAAVRPTHAIDGGYLYHFLRSSDVQSKLREGSSQTTNIANISAGRLSELPVPLAPWNEQKRIADKLDTVLTRVDAVNERLARVAPLLKRFRQSVLAAAYTGKLTQELRASGGSTSVDSTLRSVGILPRPNRYKSRTDAVIAGDYALAVNDAGMSIPEGWRWVPMVDVARMESGHTPSRSEASYWGGDVPWIGIADARNHHAGTIHETIQHTNAMGLANSAARLLPAGTVCVSRTASVGYVVKMGKPMATSQDFVNWTCTTAINADWLKWLFVAETDALPRFGKGSTHTTIYFPEWLSLKVALPPVEEQAEIVRRVETLFAFADRLEARLKAAQTAADRLTPSLLAKAFRGELVPQDPNDEPASELLKRLVAAAPASTGKRGRPKATAG